MYVNIHVGGEVIRTFRAQFLRVKERRQHHLVLVVQEEYEFTSRYFGRQFGTRLWDVTVERGTIIDPGPMTRQEELWESVYSWMNWLGI
jgi:hypothetical protein